MEAYRIDPFASTCPFCDTLLCEECGGCHGDCPDYHRCQCWEVTDERGQVTEVIPSKRCAGCGYRAPVVFLAQGICPDCAAIPSAC